MSLFDIFKKSPSHVLNYSPAGNSLIIRLSYDTETGKVVYKGRFGTKETFNMNDIDHIVNHEVSDTHHVIIVHSQNKVIATFDVLPIIVCQNIEEWLLSKGEIAYDYNEQLRGRWVNLRDVDNLIKNGPPSRQSAPSKTTSMPSTPLQDSILRPSSQDSTSSPTSEGNISTNPDHMGATEPTDITTSSSKTQTITTNGTLDQDSISNLGTSQNTINNSISQVPNNPFTTLRELKSLLDDGIITEEEFQKTKEKILQTIGLP